MIKPYLAKVEGIPDSHAPLYPFKNGDRVAVLGEIEQMPGHAIVAYDGKVIVRFHIDNFRKLKKDEV